MRFLFFLFVVVVVLAGLGYVFRKQLMKVGWISRTVTWVTVRVERVRGAWAVLRGKAEAKAIKPDGA